MELDAARYRTTDWIDPRIETCHSPLHGRGMFATAPIRSGEIVTIWGGTFLLREPDPRKKQEWRTKGYILGTIGEGLYLASLPGEGKEDLTNSAPSRPEGDVSSGGADSVPKCSGPEIRWAGTDNVNVVATADSGGSRDAD